MSDPAAAVKTGRRLRVSVLAADAMRRAELHGIVVAAGYDIVDLPDAADVVLADGDCPSVDDRPVVALGGTDTDHAGLLVRDADADQIDGALRAAATGLIVRSPATGAAGFRAMHENGLQTLLTPRETEVLTAIAQGLTNKAIARRLNISLHTVKFHVESLFRKLGVRTRSEAVAKAAERLKSGTIEL